MSFKWMTDKDGFFESSVCIGVIKLESGFALVDSGVEDSAVKKALQGIGEGFGPFKAILNTHAHADHIGGNAWSVRNRNVKVFGPSEEVHFIERTELEPHFLYGCAPVSELLNKFYCAKPSKVNVGLKPGIFELEDRRLTVLDLKGHSPGMLGYLTEEGLLYAADAVMPESIVEKHKLMFFHDLEQHLDTLDRLGSVEAPKGYILSHGGYYEDLQSLIAMNRSALLEVSELVLELASGGVQDTEIHAGLCERLGMVEGAGQYYLNHAVLRGHLKYLKDQKRLDMVWDKGRILWIPR
jgi:glyoxylase-like metal-dependent hydrolase (beta-lactamase superfamily II)